MVMCGSAVYHMLINNSKLQLRHFLHNYMTEHLNSRWVIYILLTLNVYE